MRAVERCLILVAALFLALGLRVEAAPQSSPKREAYSTSVNVEPGKAGGTYRFKAKVTLIGTGKTVAAADLTVAPGVPAKADALDEASRTRVIFQARVEEDTLTYSFSIEKGGQVVAEHEATIQAASSSK